LKEADVSLTGENYGLRIYPDGWERCGFLYLAAAEVRDSDVTSVTLVVKKIPTLQCARFTHKGPLDALPLTLDYVFHTWLPKSGQRLAQPWIIERYPEDFTSADSAIRETEILIPIE
jgi:AraC family transcriptional regulator